MKSSGQQKPNPEIAALEERIRESPQLVVDYVRLSRLLQESGDSSGAAALLQKAHFFLPNAPTIVAELRRLSKWVDEVPAPVIVTRPVIDAVEEVGASQGSETSAAAESRSAESDDLDRLIEGLAKGRLGSEEDQAQPVENEWSDDDGIIATETLAQIYAAQGQFTEAVLVYDRLAKNEKNPERAAELRHKASELRTRLPDAG